MNTATAKTERYSNVFARRGVRSLLTATALVIAASAGADQIEPQRQQELEHLLLQDCGSCHGLTLKGGLGPALQPADLTGQTVASLTAIILYGRPANAMPGWKALLSEAEANWIARRLLHGDSVGNDENAARDNNDDAP